MDNEFNFEETSEEDLRELEDTKNTYELNKERISNDLKQFGENFNSVKEIWDKIIKEYVWDWKEYTDILLHLYLSQSFKNIRIMHGNSADDGRLSLFVIAPSNSGKNMPFGFFEKLCKENEYNVSNVDKFSYQGLFGSIDAIYTPKMQMDLKQKDLREGETDDDVNYIIKRFRGVFDYTQSDFILSSEASSVLASRKNPSMVDTIRTINILLESKWKNNEITSNYKHGNVKCKSEVSCVFTSVPSDEIDIELLANGMFRRFITLYKTFDRKEKLLSMEKEATLIAQNNDIPEIVEKEEQILKEKLNLKINRIRDIINSSEEIPIVMSVDETASAEVLFYINQKKKTFYNLNDKNMSIMLSIFDYYIQHVSYKIASSVALLNGKTTITHKEMHYSLELLDSIINNIRVLVLDYSDNSSKERQEKEERLKKAITLSLIERIIVKNKNIINNESMDNVIYHITKIIKENDKNINKNVNRMKVKEFIMKLESGKKIEIVGDKVKIL